MYGFGIDMFMCLAIVYLVYVVSVLGGVAFTNFVKSGNKELKDVDFFILTPRLRDLDSYHRDTAVVFWEALVSSFILFMSAFVWPLAILVAVIYLIAIGCRKMYQLNEKIDNIGNKDEGKDK